MGEVLSELDRVLADWEPGYVRATGDWVRVGETWLPLPRGFKPSAAEVYVFPAHVDEGPSYLIETSTIDVVVRLHPRCRYASLGFGVHDLRDPKDRTVWSAIPAGTSGYRATIWALDEDIQAARELPGATFHDPRADMGGTSLDVPLERLEDYRDVTGNVEYVREGFA